MSARITRIDIEGFRVIDKLSLELRPLNVLIGENGSGKSTVLEAFDLLRKAATLSGDQFFDEIYRVHGGARMFRSNAGPGRAPPRLRLSVVATPSGGGNPYRYTLGLEAKPDGWIRIAEERLYLDPMRGEGQPLKVIERVGDRAEVYNQKAGRLERVEVGGDAILLSALNAAPGEVLNPSLPYVREMLGATRVYPALEINPAWARRDGEPAAVIRGGVVIRPATSVERGGANLPNAYQALRNRGQEAWTRVVDLIKIGLGAEVDDVTIDPDPGGGQIALSLVIRNVGKLPSFSLSDGELAYLTLVAITELETSHGGLVALDEPDLHLHPALVQRVAWFAEGMAEHRTVVLATHSDRLLDALSEPAESVVLFDRTHEFATRVLRPDPEQLARWLKRYSGLGAARADGYGSNIFTLEEPTSPATGDVES